MTSRIRRLVARIERERRLVENRFLRPARSFARSIRADANAAVRLGLDPIATVGMAIAGSGEKRGIVPILAHAMLTAFLFGRRRTKLETGGVPKNPPPPDDFKTFRNWLIAWLLLDSVSVKTLEARFASAARGAANTFAASITETMRRSLGGGSGLPPYVPGVGASGDLPEPGRSGLSILVRKQLDARGISADPAHDYAIGGLVTTQILKGYAQGQWTGYMPVPVIGSPLPPGEVKPPPAAPKAFRHISVLDGRTTQICRGADGATLPADHPYWQTHWPPLHYNCRSIIVPMFGEWEETEVPWMNPDPGFGIPW